jgi:hypothetical protein
LVTESTSRFLLNMSSRIASNANATFYPHPLPDTEWMSTLDFLRDQPPHRRNDPLFLNEVRLGRYPYGSVAFIHGVRLKVCDKIDMLLFVKRFVAGTSFLHKEMGEFAYLLDLTGPSLGVLALTSMSVLHWAISEKQGLVVPLADEIGHAAHPGVRVAYMDNCDIHYFDHGFQFASFLRQDRCDVSLDDELFNCHDYSKVVAAKKHIIVNSFQLKRVDGKFARPVPCERWPYQGWVNDYTFNVGCNKWKEFSIMCDWIRVQYKSDDEDEEQFHQAMGGNCHKLPDLTNVYREFDYAAVPTEYRHKSSFINNVVEAMNSGENSLSEKAAFLAHRPILCATICIEHLALIPCSKAVGWMLALHATQRNWAGRLREIFCSANLPREASVAIRLKQGELKMQQQPHWGKIEHWFHDN